MKIKTSDLTGAALDYAVAVALHYTIVERPARAGSIFTVEMPHRRIPDALEFVGYLDAEASPRFSPSTLWAQGGPIIEREDIGFKTPKWSWALDTTEEEKRNLKWTAFKGNQLENTEEYGPTPLIAAMRCYVASKLGAEVDVPDALLA